MTPTTTLPPQTQPDLFGSSKTEQQFAAWKLTPGGRHILNLCHRKEACYAARYNRTGRRVSMRLLWEQLRDQVSWSTRMMRKRGILPEKIDGFRLNDHLTKHCAKHIIDRHPDWRGLFEFRGDNSDS
jgi:hypothetical protein